MMIYLINLFDQVSSDKFEVEVCDACGLLASAGWCQKCRSSQRICTIHMPYACKLLFQVHDLNDHLRISI